MSLTVGELRKVIKGLDSDTPVELFGFPLEIVGTSVTNKGGSQSVALLVDSDADDSDVVVTNDEE